jgi:hypothetical protein
MTYEERVALMSVLGVELICNIPESTESFRRILPAIPTYEKTRHFEVVFFPDDGTASCTLSPFSTSSFANLAGEVKEKLLEVEGIPSSQPHCTWCQGTRTWVSGSEENRF